MRFLILIFASLFFWQGLQAQSPEVVYDKNNNLIEIRKLSETRDCGVRKITGTVRTVRNEYPVVYFDVQTPKNLETIEIHTDILSNADRANLFYSLVKKGSKVFIDGYTCGSNGVLDAIGIRLIPKPIKKKRS